LAGSFGGREEWCQPRAGENFLLGRSPRHFAVSCEADRGDADGRAGLTVCAWPIDPRGASSEAVVDALDHFLMLARLHVVDAVYGPSPETPADRQRERGLIGQGPSRPRNRPGLAVRSDDRAAAVVHPIVRATPTGSPAMPRLRHVARSAIIAITKWRARCQAASAFAISTTI
jgi:hypothetical protein